MIPIETGIQSKVNGSLCLDSASATMMSAPGQSGSSTNSSAKTERCRCWCYNHGSLQWVQAWMSDLWSRIKMQDKPFDERLEFCSAIKSTVVRFRDQEVLWEKKGHPARGEQGGPSMPLDLWLSERLHQSVSQETCFFIEHGHQSCCNGWRMEAAHGRNWWLKLTSPKNLRSCLTLWGWGNSVQWYHSRR